jgi:alkanesulfonate monooxygenase SsuD/methylene tetrahydromethanopterin reductase-like flavin-dependent oxidoreductase (luciferase family)
VADGVLLPEGSAPDAVAWATTLLGERIDATVYAWLRVEDDCPRALERMRPVVRKWRDSDAYPNLVAHAGLAHTAAFSEEDLRSVAVAGDPRDCADAITALREAGASSVVLVPIGDDHDAQFERVAADVIPLLNA